MGARGGHHHWPPAYPRCVPSLADLQVRTLGPCAYPSPLAMYVAGRETNEYYVGETDRVLYDDTVALITARGLPLDELPDVRGRRTAALDLLRPRRRPRSAS